MAYWLYREKGWSPYDYFKMSYGERVITKAFYDEEIREAIEREEEYKKWQNSSMRS